MVAGTERRVAQPNHRKGREKCCGASGILEQETPACQDFISLFWLLLLLMPALFYLTADQLSPLGS